MPELPMLPTVPRCPAALAISGACPSQQGVICRVMQRDQAEDPGIGVTAGRLRSLREGVGGVYLNLKSDPSTVVNFCHGDAVPVLTSDDGQGRASYTYCAVWQAEQDRIAAGSDDLYERVEPEPVSMGVEPYADDPWAQARDLDLLAGGRA